jgi:hypothetical protein
MEIVVANTKIAVPAMTAADWLWYLMLPVPDLDQLMRDLAPALEDHLYNEVLSVDEFYEAALEIISCASARDWWVTLRLIMVARDRWDVLGPALIERRADPNVLSLSGWLDVLLVTILDAMDPKRTTMFTMQLEVPPVAQQASNTMDEMEMDADAFLSLGQGQ